MKFSQYLKETVAIGKEQISRILSEPYAFSRAKGNYQNPETGKMEILKGPGTLRLLDDSIVIELDGNTITIPISKETDEMGDVTELDINDTKLSLGSKEIVATFDR